MADLLPSAGIFPIPYVMAYDMFPLTTLNEKKSFLKEAAEGNYVLFFETILCMNAAAFSKLKGVRPDQFFKLEELWSSFILNNFTLAIEYCRQ